LKEKAMSNIKYGTVLWFSLAKGYGFAQVEGEDDIFIHYSDVLADGFKALYKDQKISFEVGVNKQGRPKAINVQVIK
jgi:CspA family cold shock protein